MMSGNPWRLSPKQLDDARMILASVAGDILMRDASKDDPMIVAWNETIVRCHEAGEVELGTAFGLIATICRVGGEAGRDRAVAALIQIAGDLTCNPPLDPRRN